MQDRIYLSPLPRDVLNKVEASRFSMSTLSASPASPVSELDSNRIKAIIVQMLTKTLPLVYPPLTTGSPIAHQLSMALVTRRAYDWLYAHFVSIAAARIGKCLWYNFRRSLTTTTCPFLDTKVVRRADYESASDLVRQAISTDRYVMLGVDHYQLSTTGHFQREHMEHDMLVFGIDETRGVVHVADVLDGKYQHSEVLIEDLDRAHISCMPGLRKAMFFQSGGDDKDLPAVLIESNDADYVADIRAIRSIITDYICSSNTFEYVENETERYYRTGLADPFSEIKGSESFVFGQATYELLIEYIQASEGDIKKSYVNTLFEHKRLMRRRLYYYVATGLMKSRPEVVDAAQRLEQDAHHLRFVVNREMIARWSSGLNVARTKYIVDKISALRKEEERLMTEIVECLERDVTD